MTSAVVGLYIGRIISLGLVTLVWIRLWRIVRMRVLVRLAVVVVVGVDLLLVLRRRIDGRFVGLRLFVRARRVPVRVRRVFVCVRRVLVRVRHVGLIGVGVHRLFRLGLIVRLVVPSVVHRIATLESVSGVV